MRLVQKRHELHLKLNFRIYIIYSPLLLLSLLEVVFFTIYVFFFSLFDLIFDL